MSDLHDEHDADATETSAEVVAVEETETVEVLEDADGDVVVVDTVETEVVAVLEDGGTVVVDVVDTQVLEVDADDADDDLDLPEDFGPNEDGSLFTVAPAGGVAALASLPEPEVTGDARVDAAAARLGELVDLPTSDHVGVYEDVHRRLQDALADAEVT